MNTELLKSKLLEAAFNGSLTHADTSTWEFPKIGDIAFTTSGGTPQAKNKEYYESGNIRWIRSGELGVKYIYDSEIKITQKALENSSAKYYPVDSVLIALYGATVGKVAILKAESTSNQAVCAIFPNERFTPEYMYYFLSSQRDNFLGIASGGAQSNISQEKVKNSIIPLPSITEQQRIVAALEEGFAYIDAVASAKQNLSDTAELLRGKILEDAISGTLTNADTSTWTLMTLNDLFKITTGKKDANFGDKNGEYEFFTCSNTPLKSKTYSYDGDYLIMPGNGANIGQVRHYTGKFEAYQRTYLMQAIQPVNLDYVKFHLENGWAKYNEDKIFGAATPYIKLGNLTSYPILLPPLADQQRIVAKIEELFAEIDKLK